MMAIRFIKCHQRVKMVVRLMWSKVEKQVMNGKERKGCFKGSPTHYNSLTSRAAKVEIKSESNLNYLDLVTAAN